MNNSQIEERKNDDEKWSMRFGCDPDEGSVGFGHVHIPRITIWDRIFGNCEKGVHNFQNFLLESYLPSINAEYVTPSILRESRTLKYEIRCTRCGRKPE